MDELSREYLSSKLNSEYGRELADKIIKGYSCKRFASFRVNRIKSTVEEIERELNRSGIIFDKVSWFDDAFIIKNATEREIVELDVYKDGKIYLQNLSSMIPPLILNAVEKDDVLDMAAAPGGKTTEIASLTNNKANITACELNRNRAEKLTYNIEKQGAKKVNVILKNAVQLDDFYRFDKILLDAPCTGSGTVSFGAENSKESFNDNLLTKITDTQLKLLDKGVKLLKSGKSIVYSTCSVFKEENEQIIEKILKRYKNVHVEPIDLSKFTGVDFISSMEGTLLVCPNEYYEGFFVAKLVKD